MKKIQCKLKKKELLLKRTIIEKKTIEIQQFVRKSENRREFK